MQIARIQTAKSQGQQTSRYTPNAARIFLIRYVVILMQNNSIHE